MVQRMPQRHRLCDTPRMSMPAETASTVAALLKAAAAQLSSDAPRLEAECLLMHVLGVGRAWLYAHDRDPVPPSKQSEFGALLERRVRGEPIAYLTGEREFYGLPLKVGPAALIPRHDTELLVELALQRLPPEAAVRVLDLGTGSGAIALALADRRPHAEVFGCDSSPAALALARANAEALGLSRVQWTQGDWWQPFEGQGFELVVSNPPYIEDTDPHLEQGDLRFEPRSALASGPDGLDDLRRIIAGAPSHLRPGGWLLLEHGCLQGPAVRDLLEAAGFQQVQTWSDIEARPRVSGGCL